jgi:hypothetical protein
MKDEEKRRELFWEVPQIGTITGGFDFGKNEKKRMGNGSVR